jgi:hypothetical protein
MTLVLLLLAATPVSLNVDLSKNTTARLGPKVRESIEARLLEEGFSVESGAKLKLSVEELHGTLKLAAQAGEFSATSELKPALEWSAELGFELGQRLAVLAHEAEAHLPVAVPPRDEEAPLPDPLPAEAGRGSDESPAPVPEKRLKLSAGFRMGILVRATAIDPSLAFHGSLPTGSVEPAIAMGLTFAPGPGLSAWEVPLLGGIRVPIALGNWTLTPELLGGGRVHFYAASDLDSGGVRFDPLGTLAIAFFRALGPVKLGVRVGVEVSSAREHRLGDEILWSRGGFALSTMLQLER